LLSLALSISDVRAALPECAPDIRVEQELLIRDRAVLDSPAAQARGNLSFGHLFARFAGSADPKRLDEWLGEWLRTEIDGGVPSQLRPSGILRQLWPTNPGAHPDPAQAPFALSAILFRPDLDPPELHFVYNLISRVRTQALPFSAILEFVVPEESWSRRFHALGALDSSTATLNALAGIVRDLPSANARLRTNDLLLGAEWDLREFRIHGSGQVHAVPLPGTPAITWDSPGLRQTLAAWVAGHPESTMELPRTYQTANALVPNEGFGWLRDAGLPEPLRKRFSLQTCNGCHGGETQTRFTHISLHYPGGETRISDFLQADLPARKTLFQDRICSRLDRLKARNQPRAGRPH
jgi:hypothetical protein